MEGRDWDDGEGGGGGGCLWQQRDTFNITAGERGGMGGGGLRVTNEV